MLKQLEQSSTCINTRPLMIKRIEQKANTLSISRKYVENATLFAGIHLFSSMSSLKLEGCPCYYPGTVSFIMAVLRHTLTYGAI